MQNYLCQLQYLLRGKETFKTSCPDLFVALPQLPKNIGANAHNAPKVRLIALKSPTMDVVGGCNLLSPTD